MLRARWCNRIKIVAVVYVVVVAIIVCLPTDTVVTSQHIYSVDLSKLHTLTRPTCRNLFFSPSLSRSLAQAHSMRLQIVSLDLNAVSIATLLRLNV